jgi:hypothetical protein
MTLAFVHYHLEPGGVSKVIITASRILSAAGIPHVILTSSASDEALATAPIRIVPGLAYRCSNDSDSPEELTQQLRTAATEALGKHTGTSFHDWHQHASHLLTTSVAEGFGMVFLEAIASGKPLLGRDLPHLTADHAALGIQTGRFYERILIPDDWVGMETLEQHLRVSLTDSWTAAGIPLPNNAVKIARNSLLHHGFLDFGNLPESLQQLVICRLTDHENLKLPLIESRGIRRPAAEWLAETLAETSPTAETSALEAYSPEDYLTTLSAITRN